MKVAQKNGIKWHILLADDDKDDRFFFEEALKNLTDGVRFTTVGNGDELIKLLSSYSGPLPDVLFLDLNMPRKNGIECLSEIKRDKKLKDIPVIIYSTALYDGIADLLYENGAHYYFKKCDLSELSRGIQKVLTSLLENEYQRSRDKFIFNWA